MATVAALAHTIWNQHYGPIIGQAQVDYMLHNFQSLKAVKKQIEEGYRYFIIYKNEKPSGYLALVSCKSEKKTMISKIYINKEQRGCGLGKQLLNFAHQQALSAQQKTLWLTVNKYNTKAINWYKKQGFKITDAIVNPIGEGYVMDDYIMEKPV